MSTGSFSNSPLDPGRGGVEDGGRCVGSQAALLTIALRNVRVPGAAVAGLGIAMNLAVMLANGGLMPIAPETLAASGRVEAIEPVAKAVRV